MKRSQSLRRYLATLLLLAVTTLTWAYDFQRNGIYYNKNSDGTSVSVTRELYSGSVTIPSTVLFDGETYNVTIIEVSAFRDCHGLTSVTIPESVKGIGAYAFYGCHGLTSVTIPESVKSIEYYAFYGCYGLTSVTIPNSVTSIGDYAFSGCHGLESVTIPESVTSIGIYAFYGCDGLTSVTIPNSVTSIGDYAFSGCSGLTSVTINSNDIVSKNYTYASKIGTVFGNWVKEYIIGDNVESIGDFAFYGCDGLTSVTIPESVTSIGVSAFSGCSGLTSVTINSNDIVSKNYTSASNLGTIIANRVKEYIIGDNVESIGDYAFYGCSELTSVTIGNSVTSIGDYAFGSSGLTSVTIPESVTSIGGYVFSGCDYLSGISVNRTEPEKYNCYYSAFDNIDYNRVVLYVPKGYEKAYAQCNPWSKFPNIKEHNSNVQGKSFTLRCARGYVYGDGTKLAGTTDASQASEFAIVAYNGQTYLYDATNKAFVVHTTAAKAGTTGNPSLESKDDFSKAVTGLTWGTTGYESYPYYLEDSFGNWMNMDKSSNVYMNTWKDFEGGNGGNTYAVTIVDTEFDATEAIEMLSNYYKNPMQGKSFTLRCARGYVYGDGTKLAGTTDASQASEFAIVAYNGQTYLYDATNKAFVVHTTAAKAGTTGNPSLESKDDFSKAVTGLTWGTTGYESYPYYLEDSFGNWMNMDKSSNVYMNTWKDFEGGNGGNTYAVTIVDTEFDATEAIEMLSNYYKNPMQGKSFTLRCARGYVYGDGTKLAGTTDASQASEFAIVAYNGQTYLYDATNKAFVVHTTAAKAGTTGNPSLESKDDFSKAVTGLTWGTTGYESYPYYLEDSFGNWMNMDKSSNVYMNTWKDFEGGNGGNTYAVTIVDTEFDATEAIEMLDAYYNPVATVTYDFVKNGIYYNKNSDGTSVSVTYKTTSYNSYSGSVTIPATVTYNDKTFNVTSIGDYAFSGCPGLKSLTIPESVTSIGDYAFEGCSGLTSVTIPNSVKSIGDGAFFRCDGLTSVTIPESVTSIGRGAFQGCSGLTSLTIPNSVKSIGDSVFRGCSGLTSLTIPESVTSIGDFAFSGCSGLTSVTIPNSVTSIGDHAFSGCSGLTSVTIPNSVTSIGWSAFDGCSGLTSVTIPESVTEIGLDAFAECGSLAEIFCYAVTPPSSSNKAFEGDNLNTVTLYVPFESLKKYQTTSPWNEFGTIRVIGMFKVSYFVDGEAYQTEWLPEGETIIPATNPTKQGHTFSGWSEIPEKMPAHDVEVTGSFSINSYTLTYKVDGEEYRTSTVVYGAELTAETEPAKEGYTFSGWSEVPEKMPAHDVEVTGSFSINSYTLTYKVDGEEYRTSTVVYGAELTAETEPAKEGYTFSGWSEVPEKMPAHDVEVTGSFSINSYTLTYKVDGEEYRTSTVVYGAELTAETEPAKEGYTFSGWSEVPEKMPAHDVEITGSFSVNKYTVTFKYGDVQLSTAIVNYGEEIPLPESLDSDRYTLVEWLDVPATMPAHDITIQASFTDGVSSIGMGQQTKEPQYYDLSGRKLTRPSKGITIVNGKKVLVK